MSKSNRLALLAVAIALAGCAYPKSPVDTCGSAACPDDAQITAEVRRRISLQPSLRIFNIDVRTVDGAVYLQGLVDTLSDQRTATDAARAVPGVRKVYNDLSVHGNGI